MHNIHEFTSTSVTGTYFFFTVIVIGFVSESNFTEGDGIVEACFAPVFVPAEGFSVSINVSASVIMDSIDPQDCSGSGLASS